MKKSMQMIVSTIIIVLLVVLDQITKYVAVVKLKEQSPIVVIENIFEFYYLENKGAAFGILQGKKWFFILTTSCLILLMVYLLIKLKPIKRYYFLQIILVLFISGAIGNLIDRVIHNYVIDFLYFKLIDFPIFNIADIYVTCAATCFIICTLFIYKEEDFDHILPSFSKKSRSNR